MANPDSIQQRKRQAKARANRQNQGEEFHETLAETLTAPTTPIPNRTYRSEIDTNSNDSTGTQIVQFIAIVLNILLAVRFLVSLFSSDSSNGLVSFFYGLTDWIATPFQALFGPVPATGSGFFDGPAIAAIVVVSLLAAALTRLIRAPRV